MGHMYGRELATRGFVLFWVDLLIFISWPVIQPWLEMHAFVARYYGICISVQSKAALRG